MEHILHSGENVEKPRDWGGCAEHRGGSRCNSRMDEKGSFNGTKNRLGSKRRSEKSSTQSSSAQGSGNVRWVTLKNKRENPTARVFGEKK